MRKTIPAKSLSFPMDQEELLSKIILMKKRQYQSSRRLWQQQAMTKNVSQIRILETKPLQIRNRYIPKNFLRIESSYLASIK